MIENQNSLVKYLFLFGLSDKSIEQLLTGEKNNLTSNYIPEILSFYSSEGINSKFNMIKEKFNPKNENYTDLMNNIFPMKSDYLDIITSDDYDERNVKNIKKLFTDYIIEINDENKNVPEHIYHCFQYEMDIGAIEDLILNFGVLIFYENIIKDKKEEFLDKNKVAKIYAGKALVLISEKPIFSLMKQILEKIYIDLISQKFSVFNLESFFVNVLNSLNNDLSSIKFKNEISITYNPFQEQILPFCDLNIGYFFEIFDINDIFLIAEYYFLNKSIIIISPNIELLYPIYHLLMTLFFPLNFHLRSYFYKLLYPLLVVEGLCGLIPCFYFIYSDTNINDGYLNKNIINKIATEKGDVLIYQIRKNQNQENNKFDIKKSLYIFKDNSEIPLDSMKGKTLIESIITNDFVYKSIIYSEYKRIKKLVENINTDFFDIPLDLKEYDLLRKNFLGMIIKFLVIKIKPLTFTLNEDDKMEICLLMMEKDQNQKKDENDKKVEEFLGTPQTEVIYKNSLIKYNNLNIDYLKTQMLLDNFIKISQSDPNTFYFDVDNINVNTDKTDKNNKVSNNKNKKFEEIFNYNSGNCQISKDDIKSNNKIIGIEELKKHISINKEKIENFISNKINLFFFFNENFILNFDKFNKEINKEDPQYKDKSNLIKIYFNKIFHQIHLLFHL